MKSLNVAIVGLSEIGAALARKLQNLQMKDEDCKLRLVAVCDEKPNKYLQLDGIKFYESHEDVAKLKNVDVVVETLSGIQAGHDVAADVLNQGKHYVTSNVTLLAGHMRQLINISKDKGVHLRAEATLIGAVPCLHMLSSGLSGTDIRRVYGVLNADAHVVLSRMLEREQEIDEAMKDCKELGYDAPDLSGKDTLHKLAVARLMAFGLDTDIQKIKPTGIAHVQLIDLKLANKLGYQLRLVGAASPTGVRVAPHMVADDDPLSALQSSHNAMVVETEDAGAITLGGDGHRVDTVVSGLIADLFAISNDRKKIEVPQKDRRGNAAPDVRRVRQYYLRFTPEQHSGFNQSRQMLVVDELNDESGYTAQIVKGEMTRAEAEDQLGHHHLSCYEVLLPRD